MKSCGSRDMMYSCACVGSSGDAGRADRGVAMLGGGSGSRRLSLVRGTVAASSKRERVGGRGDVKKQSQQRMNAKSRGEEFRVSMPESQRRAIVRCCCCCCCCCYLTGDAAGRLKRGNLKRSESRTGSAAVTARPRRGSIGLAEAYSVGGPPIGRRCRDCDRRADAT